jgi:hypothetical protein
MSHLDFNQIGKENSMTHDEVMSMTLSYYHDFGFEELLEAFAPILFITAIMHNILEKVEEIRNKK